jgi:hypothetical protein
MSNRKLRMQTISASLTHQAPGLRARAARAGSSTLRVHKSRARKRGRRAVLYLDGEGGRHGAAPAARRAPRARVQSRSCHHSRARVHHAEGGGVRGTLDLLKEFATKLPDLWFADFWHGYLRFYAPRSCSTKVGSGSTSARLRPPSPPARASGRCTPADASIVHRPTPGAPGVGL